ncbi:MAG: pseudouridine synthase [Anaerolineaceae bacterium]|nr:pseudouridine synthase [Anaerolineaceae bacterium]
MAQANIGSRRECEELIRQGRVKINGAVAELGAKADPQRDVIEFDGLALKLENQQKVYIAVHKPINVLSTDAPHKKDPRRTVRDLVPVEGHLFMIGRLDAESSGLMVLTNDGDLANRLTHPRYRHTKTYRVTVYGLPDPATIRQWEEGVFLPEESSKTAPCSVLIKKADKGLTVLEVVLTEGKKRQIRRVAAMLGFPVRHLTRTHIGQLALGTMSPGEWRELSQDDLQALRTPHPIVRKLRAASRKPNRRKRQGQNDRK